MQDRVLLSIVDSKRTRGKYNVSVYYAMKQKMIRSYDDDNDGVVCKIICNVMGSATKFLVDSIFSN